MESRNDTPVEEILVAEDPEESQRNRSLFAGVALAVIVLLVIWWILSQLVVVPDVVGMQERDARATIEETGLEISEVFRLPSAADPAGEVIAQCPEAGMRVFKWRLVRLFVVTGDGVDDGVEEPDGTDVDLAWGTERDTEPAAAPTRPAGPQRVPQVFDMSESAAIALLRRTGYRAAVEYGDSSTNVSRGLVFYQNPPPDTVAPRGTVVTIRVSTGPPVLGLPSSADE
ncbi:MAG: PASTA domain-containing protein [Coriobacteriia bacterium]|nr:PASTA domain-containing protein [Coriobacteriia bacterium]